MMTVLQMAENLTDRVAVQRVRFDLSWKYCLELEGVGFDASVLSEYRTRAVDHGLEVRVLGLLLAALKEKDADDALASPEQVLRHGPCGEHALFGLHEPHAASALFERPAYQWT
ncbi:transposase [Streptomyces sp. NPDC058964]|uniref:transposase n=1 Tax=Streptomyces sp. NPDC058964 TaxID=3346681 RepID=UPI003692F9B8